MSLEAFIESLDSVSESLRTEYVESPDGKGFVLDVKDGLFKSKIGEFRGNNIELQKKLDDAAKYLAKFKGIDPAKHAEAVAELQKYKEAQLIDAGKLDEVVTQRTEAMKLDSEAKIASLQEAVEKSIAETDSYKGLYQDHLITSTIAGAFDGVATMRKGALSFLSDRARATWRMNADQQLQAFNGDQPLYGPKGDPLTAEDWARGMVRASPFLFEGSTGGGANGSAGDDSETGGKTVKFGDKAAFAANLEDIATGVISVVP